MAFSGSNNLQGALLMVAAMACYTFNDALIKFMGGDMSMSQLFVLRGLPTILFVGILTYRAGAMTPQLNRSDWMLISLRSLSELLAAYLFVSALRQMEIANVTAVLQVLPLTVALAAALFFQEPLGWRRFVAIGIGFLGMVLIVRPGPEGFNPATFNALAAVVFITIRDLTARRLSAEVPSLFVALHAAVCVTVLASGVLLIQGSWQPVAAGDGLLILGMAVFIGGGYLFSTMVMRVGDIGFVAPFRYTGLVWALLIGLLVFGDWPDALTLLGAAIVVGTGLFTLFREARANRSQAKAART
ncbi:DMT family transporter [Cognatishimia sp. WU-CL00825]|uniref:DMT family transporter n=1 Tax=Cognatishimia sp. WU-CL00825 TaxID=3127658 RepID=UPI00310BA875